MGPHRVLDEHDWENGPIGNTNSSVCNVKRVVLPIGSHSDS